MKLSLFLASLAAGKPADAVYDRVNYKLAGIPARNENGFYVCPPYVEDLDYWNILAAFGGPRLRRRAIVDRVALFLGA
jgi:hypothetical protein